MLRPPGGAMLSLCPLCCSFFLVSAVPVVSILKNRLPVFLRCPLHVHHSRSFVLFMNQKWRQGSSERAGEMPLVPDMGLCDMRQNTWTEEEAGAGVRPTDGQPVQPSQGEEAELEGPAEGRLQLTAPVQRPEEEDGNQAEQRWLYSFWAVLA